MFPGNTGFPLQPDTPDLYEIENEKGGENPPVENLANPS